MKAGGPEYMIVSRYNMLLHLRNNVAFSHILPTPSSQTDYLERLVFLFVFCFFLRSVLDAEDILSILF